MFSTRAPHTVTRTLTLSDLLRRSQLFLYHTVVFTIYNTDYMSDEVMYEREGQSLASFIFARFVATLLYLI